MKKYTLPLSLLSQGSPGPLACAHWRTARWPRSTAPEQLAPRSAARDRQTRTHAPSESMSAREQQKRPADEAQSASKRVCDDSRLTKYVKFEEKLRQHRIEQRIVTLVARTVDELRAIGGSVIVWWQEGEYGRGTEKALHFSYEDELLEVWSMSDDEFRGVDTWLPTCVLMSASVPRSDLELSVRKWVVDRGCCNHPRGL